MKCLSVAIPVEIAENSIVKKSLEFIPPGIHEIFSIQTIDNNGKQTSWEEERQLFRLKNIYYAMLLELLGVPVDRPLSVAENGEWAMTPENSSPPVSLSEAFLDETEIQAVAQQVRLFFELEAKWGLVLMGNALTTFTEKDAETFFVLKNDKVISGVPKIRLDFIQGSNQTRRQKIRKFLKTHFPKPLTDAIFKKKFSRGPEKTAEHLASFVKLEQLTCNDLLEQSTVAITFLRALNAGLIDPTLKTTLLTFEDIYALAKKLIIAKGNRTDVRNTLKQAIFLYLFKNYQCNSNDAFFDLLGNLFQSLGAKLNEESKNDPKLQIRYQKEGDDHYTVPTNRYFNSIFWSQFLEELEEVLEPKAKDSSSLDCGITLLRAANLLVEQDLEKKEKITQALHHLLHSELKKQEKQRIVSLVRSALFTTET